MNKLIENAKKGLNGTNPMVHISDDLASKKGYDCNSWFAIGHHEVNGTILDYLYHVMEVRKSGKPAMIASCFSVTDETHGKFYGDTNVYPIMPGMVNKDKFFVKCPGGTIKGDLDKMSISASMKHAKLELELTGAGYPLYNAGTGKFNMLGMEIYEYSLPNMKSLGTLTIDGIEYPLDGECWFDRQWENMTEGEPTWGWMDVNLSDGSIISAWFPIENGKEDAWATYMAPDGTHKVVKMNPVVTGVTDFWHNEGSKSPYSYPTKWHLSIPEIDTEIDVIPQPLEQELVCDKIPTLSHYEAASKMTGQKDGHNVTGYGYIELTGNWNENMIH